MKYNVGDRVKIVSIIKSEDVGENADILLGAEGTIVGIDSSYKYPYEIQFDNTDIHDLGCVFWAESELRYDEDTAIFEQKIKDFVNSTHSFYDTNDTADFIIEYRKEILDLIR